MTNAKDPIVQTVYRQTGKESYRPATEKEIREGIYLVHKEGLNKREHFAAIILQGMYSNNGLVDQWDCEGIMALNAVKAADALIVELNKSEPVNKGLAE